MTETRDQADGTTAAGWDCEAYGAEGAKVGALCFFSPELGERDCRSAGQCSERMAGERRRVYGRISEMAAAGDPTGEYLAEAFGSPDDLLGGFGERPPAAASALTLAEAVRRAGVPSCGVARLECAPDVVGYLRSLAAEAADRPPWLPAPIAPLGAVPVMPDGDMPAGRWRMVDAAGDAVWEGSLDQ